MTQTKSRWLLAGVLAVALALVAGLGWAAVRAIHRPGRSSSSASASPAPTPTPSPTPLVLSRGQQVATLPAVCQGSEQATVACRYVIALASPDSRLDASELATWRRTEPFSTSALYDRNKGIKEPRGDVWWTNLRQQDGWVEPIIDNVVGDAPQAPGPRSSAGEPTVLTVVYHRKIHTDGLDATTDTAVRQTTVTLTSGTRPLVSNVTVD